MSGDGVDRAIVDPQQWPTNQPHITSSKSRLVNIRSEMAQDLVNSLSSRNRVLISPRAVIPMSTLDHDSPYSRSFIVPTVISFAFL